MTKKADLLLEILTEELPPKNLTRLAMSLKESIAEGLKTSGFEYELDDALLATPRRLVVILNNVTAKQPDQVIERKGPLSSISFFPDGAPKPQATGFAKSCDVSVEQLERLDTPKGECLYFKKTEPGKSIFDCLPDIVTEAIKKLPIKKQMRWGDHDITFERPVHGIILMYGRKIVPGIILEKTTSNKTQGHRFYNTSPITISSAKAYIKTLKKYAHVYVDFNERKNIIRTQTIHAAQRIGSPVINDALLDEVTASTEWPMALLAKFSNDFLSLPKEVLIASMEKHQRCFPVVDQSNQLLPNFIAIANIKPYRTKYIISGNERVMRARLSDAKFFYETDLKHPLNIYIDQLGHVVFQKQLGTLLNKTQRLQKLSGYIAKQLHFKITDIERAALLSKTDLMTSMVGEFPELQGIMGEYYARHDNEPETVAIALKEQYMPRFATDDLPQTATGQALAIADRIDTLVGMFGINQIPTGTKDPFALRRAAFGLIRIMIEHELHLNLNELIKETYNIYKHSDHPLPKEHLGVTLGTFILDRLATWVGQNGFTLDQYHATLGGPIWHEDLVLFHARLKAVQHFATLPEAESLAAANKRVKNILIKNEAGILKHVFKMDLLKESAEIQLARDISKRIETVAAFEKNCDYTGLLIDLAQLRDPVDRFFETVMVMDEDPKLQQNRLALLVKLRELFLKVADISLLQIGAS
ncbi:MAG: glycine--tRNA ligase subunit beta [Pseudomonadota bacterium]